MTTVARAAAEPLPLRFGIRLDQATEQPEPGVLVGGQPMTVLRLTDAGADAWPEIQAGTITTRAGGRLARRLIDAGLAHPEPPPAEPVAVTIVIPVHGRATQLDRCLTALGGRHRVVVVDDGSPDAAAIASVAERHSAVLVRREHNGGPAAARNLGVLAAATDLIAFIDSDTVPAGDWIIPLAAHLQDPVVGAVAPRIVPLDPAGVSLGRSALDLGGQPAQVRPYSTVGYVPTAALLVRRSALADVSDHDGPFDAAMRVGEDVDFIWRLLDAGWRVRYEPAVTVAHEEPATPSELLRRRFGYGTSAAPLARRHPDNMAPFVIHPWFAATVAAVLGGRPLLAVGAFTGSMLTTRRAVVAAGLPPRRILPGVARGVQQTWLGASRYATQFASPLLLAAVLTGRPRRRLAAASLLFGAAASGWRPGSRHSPITHTVSTVADDIAYGAGVLYGCCTQRTLGPLRPRVLRTPIRKQSS